jgi:hypothetical protein
MSVSVPAGNVSLGVDCEANINSFFDKLFFGTTGSF